MQSGRSQPPAGPAGPAVTPPADQTYVGTKKCNSCHLKQWMAWKKTKHATDAFAKLPAKYKTDASCLACHSTGFGAATGFKDEASTPNLAGTTCEACHGPGSASVASGEPFISKKTLSPEETQDQRHDLQSAAAERLSPLPCDPGPQGTSEVRQGVGGSLELRRQNASGRRVGEVPGQQTSHPTLIGTGRAVLCFGKVAGTAR